MNLLQLFSILGIIFGVSILIWFFTYTHSKRNIEAFNTVEINVDIPSNIGYTPSQFQLECTHAIIKPTDCKFTNIINFMKHVDTFNFVGVTPFPTHFYVITTNHSTITMVKEIPENSVIYYTDETSLCFIQHLMIKVYKKTLESFSFKQISENIGNYINNHCNSYDINNNMFIDFYTNPDSHKSFFVYGLNSHFDEKLSDYYNNYFGNGNRTKYLLLTDNDPYKLSLIQHSFFKANKDNNEMINPYRISMDDIIYTDKNIEEVDINKLIENNYIDFNRSQVYMDVYNCNIPDEVEANMQASSHDVRIIEQNKYELKKYRNSCDSRFPNNENMNTNKTYLNLRCINGNNMFVDIMFPFAFDYDIKLSDLDFNKLTIFGDTFDGQIPIHPINNNNRFINRYKVNVNPHHHTVESFIDDIYYNSDIMKNENNNETYTVFTNSIPLEFDETKYKVEWIQNFNTITYFITSVDYEDVYAQYTLSDNTKKIVSLFEGDRVFLKPEYITDSKLSIFISNNMQLNNKNFYHGTVVKGTSLKYNKEQYQKLVIKMVDIRKNHDIKGACFDENWESNSDEMTAIQTEQECESNDERNLTWDIPCKFNYECPFYQKNKNYDNHRGGCLNNGSCDMPVGIRHRSFKKYDESKSEENHPLCYNCPPNTLDSKCCAEQELSANNDKNSQFKSSDYMFIADYSDRKKLLFTSDSSCNKNSLMVNKYL
uniref:Uncharacterized protein n=1 Tax=viral metagenome TaxID=1070528 RepID=A0A6C0BQ58_9ZZZZ